jgi:hypothetical protein
MSSTFSFGVTFCAQVRRKIERKNADRRRLQEELRR